MGEQHDLPEAHALQFVQAIDDGLRRPDQAALLQPECRYPETLLGELPDPGQRRVVRRERHDSLDREHDGVRVAADVRADAAQHRRLVLQLAERIRGYVPHVGVARHQRQRVLLADTADHDGRPGLLNRTGLDRHVPHREMLAGEIDSFVGERLAQNLQRLAEPLRSLGERTPVQPDPVVLVLDGTAADAELQPSGRDLVECGRHLREHRGMAKLVAQHHVSDLDPLGAAEQRGRQGPRLHRGVVGCTRGIEVVVKPQ